MVEGDLSLGTSRFNTVPEIADAFAAGGGADHGSLSKVFGGEVVLELFSLTARELVGLGRDQECTPPQRRQIVEQLPIGRLKSAPHVHQDNDQTQVAAAAEKPLHQPLPLLLDRSRNAREAVPGQVGENDGFVDQEEVDFLRTPGTLTDASEFVLPNQAIEERGFAHI